MLNNCRGVFKLHIHVYYTQKVVCKSDQGHMTLWAIYAQFSKDQNSALKHLLLFLYGEGYSWISYEGINIKTFLVNLPNCIEMATSTGVGV